MNKSEVNRSSSEFAEEDSSELNQLCLRAAPEIGSRISIIMNEKSRDLTMNHTLIEPTRCLWSLEADYWVATDDHFVGMERLPSRTIVWET